MADYLDSIGSINKNNPFGLNEFSVGEIPNNSENSDLDSLFGFGGQGQGGGLLGGFGDFLQDDSIISGMTNQDLAGSLFSFGSDMFGAYNKNKQMGMMEDYMDMNRDVTNRNLDNRAAAMNKYSFDRRLADEAAQGKDRVNATQGSRDAYLNKYQTKGAV